MIFVVYVFCGFIVCCQESLPCSGVRLQSVCWMRSQLGVFC